MPKLCVRLQILPDFLGEKKKIFEDSFLKKLKFGDSSDEKLMSRFG